MFSEHEAFFYVLLYYGSLSRQVIEVLLFGFFKSASDLRLRYSFTQPSLIL